ncbi:hypothetical protein [Tsukamurella pseudospumae]|uniref:Uncharacterized protein n=1 Tax=Tsukamurella pseudospumae TaxID=239498 RepID=A0A138AJ42_9ACTN|nr:hypothetical protein [Tsukamurella pseudospumae]KXP00172.1 hypothetical protein AXK61_15860 [Tsukamurella pseudospumae]KXP10493.1 hypothetical protein AXK60_07685 [Tsukamurella pseudospumae]
MRSGIVLVAGIALLVLGVQGGIRLLVDHANEGLLRWMPGGFVVHLVVYVAAAVVGLVLASRGKGRAESSRN